jgi:hypothetical protein
MHAVDPGGHVRGAVTVRPLPLLLPLLPLLLLLLLLLLLSCHMLRKDGTCTCCSFVFVDGCDCFDIVQPLIDVR